MEAPFFVLSLPRSRSFWLANFLAYQGRLIGHDAIIGCRSTAEYLAKFQLGLSGSCETGLVFGWRLLVHMLPQARLVVIKRPLGEIAASFQRQGFAVDMEELARRDAMLDAVSRQPRTLTFDFEALAEPPACQHIFEYCLGVPFDWAWWNHYQHLNLQIDLGARFLQLQALHPQLEALKSAVNTSTRALEPPQCMH